MEIKNNYSQMPLTYLNKYFENWHELLIRHQSLNIFSLKKTGLVPRLHQFVEWRKKKHRVDTQLLDLEYENLTDPYSLKLSLNKITCDTIVIFRDLATNQAGIKQVLQSHYIRGKSSLILAHEYTPQQLLDTDENPSLYYTNHKMITPPLNRDDRLNYIYNICKLWNINCPTHFLEHLLSYCGNQPWLINEYLRIVTEFPDIAVEQIESNSSLIQRSTTLFNSLPKEYIEYFSSRVVGSNVIKELEAFGLLSNKQVTGSWITQASKKYKNSQLNISPNHINYENSDITNSFTTGEVAILQLFGDHPEIFTQEKIATVYYQTNDSDYSNWALAQVISRLRRKISLHTLPLKVVTKRGKGYELSRI